MEETVAQVIADTAAKERTEEIIAYILKWDSRQAHGELANAIRRRFLGNPMERIQASIDVLTLAEAKAILAGRARACETLTQP